jgi:hypothetical protein
MNTYRFTEPEDRTPAERKAYAKVRAEAMHSAAGMQPMIDYAKIIAWQHKLTRAQTYALTEYAAYCYLEL